MAPTPVFLLGEFQGQRNLVGYSTWSLKESDTTKRLTVSLMKTKSRLVVFYVMARGVGRCYLSRMGILLEMINGFDYGDACTSLSIY